MKDKFNKNMARMTSKKGNLFIMAMIIVVSCIVGCQTKKENLDPKSFHSDISSAYQNIQDYNDGMPAIKQQLTFVSLEETKNGYEMSFNVSDLPFIRFYFHKDESLSKIVYGNIDGLSDVNYDDLWIIAAMSSYYTYPQIINDEEDFHKVDDFLGTFHTSKQTNLRIHEKGRPLFKFKKDRQQQTITLTVE